MTLRIATIDLSPELFIEFCKASSVQGRGARRFVIKENPLPDDAEVVRIGLKDTYEPYTLRLFIKSEQFAEVPEGGTPPELPLVVYQTIYDESP